MKHKLPHAFLLLLAALFVTPALAQNTGAEVRVQLSLAREKKVFRSGEPIRVVLSFTSDREGFQVNVTTTKPASPVDEILLTPRTGVSGWLDEYSGSHRYFPDYSANQKITSAPVKVELPLNDWFRFDRPGKYTVRVKTNRVSGAARPGDRPGQRLHEVLPPLTTNEVTFEVLTMKKAEEEQEIRRLSTLLQAAKVWQAEAGISEELSYLTGEASTREKVRLYVTSHGRSGNFSGNIFYGLFIARDRALAVRLMESALRDPGTPVTHQLLNALTQLRSLQEGIEPQRMGFQVRDGNQHQSRALQIQNNYVRELVVGLPRRAGKSRTTTAMTVLANLPQEPEQAAQMLRDVREILLQEFEELHPFEQEYLLRQNWDQLKDPALAPAIERILADKNIPQGQIVRTTALKRLLEIAPARARPFFVAEISNPDSLADFEVLTTLDVSTLPEVDSALLDQIIRKAQLGLNFDRVHLKHKASLAARYATPAVYGQLMEVYQKYRAKWPPDARASLLAYFARHNEAEAMPLIEQALEDIRPEQYFNFLPQLARLRYSEGIDALLRTILERDEPEAVNTASYVMSLHGPEADSKFIEARLERWMKEWGERTEELNGRGGEANITQGMVQVNLIIALTRARGWKLPEEKVKQLQKSCATQICKQHFPVR